MKFDLEKTKRLIKEGKSYASVLRGLDLETNSTLNKFVGLEVGTIQFGPRRPI